MTNKKIPAIIAVFLILFVMACAIAQQGNIQTRETVYSMIEQRYSWLTDIVVAPIPSRIVGKDGLMDSWWNIRANRDGEKVYFHVIEDSQYVDEEKQTTVRCDYEDYYF